ncbi:MAG: hypothetical protein IKN12_07770 [Selenomonadaceae bacterium]|nr:hypothetical protein [Selenomonadaceae bacterium]
MGYNFTKFLAFFVCIVCLSFAVCGCGKDEKNGTTEAEISLGDVKEVKNVKEQEHKNDNSNTDNSLYGTALDTSISVSKAEMDKFIPITRDLKLSEAEVKLLTQVFKQTHIDINKLSDYTIKRDMKSTPNGIGGFIDTIFGIELVSMFDRVDMRMITIYIQKQTWTCRIC